MASIGEDDVFDEAIVTNYLKEVNMIAFPFYYFNDFPE